MSSRRPRLHGLKGYRLHASRIEYTGYKDAMRTIKYPLRHDDSAVLKGVADDVFYDYAVLYGAGDLATYLEKKKSGGLYTVLDFWVDALRVGGIFTKKQEALKSLIDKLYSTKSQVDEEIEASPLSSILNHDLVKNAVTTRPRPKAATFMGKRKSLLECFVDQVRDQWEDKIDAFIKQSHELTGDEAIDAKRKFFQVSASKTTAVDRVNTLGFTFTLLPLFDVYDQSVEKGEVFHRRLQQYGGLLCCNNRQALVHVGVSDNGGALNHLLNKYLGLLCDSPGEVTRNTLELVPEWRDREKELRQRVEYLASKARLLPRPKVANNWHDYRHEISGKLSGWLSNFANHEEKIRQQIERHAGDLNKVLVYVNAIAGDDKYMYAGRDRDVVSIKEEVKKLLDILKNGNVHAVVGQYARRLPPLRRTLNEFIQREEVATYLWTDKDIKKKKKGQQKKTEGADVADELVFEDVFPNLGGTIRETPKFYGAGKKELYEKFMYAGRYAQELLGFIERAQNVLRETPIGAVEMSDDEFMKKLQQVVRLYKKLQHQPFKDAIRRAMLEFVDVQSLGEFDVIWKSPKARDRRLKTVSLVAPENKPEAIRRVAIGISVNKQDWKTLSDEDRVEYAEMYKVASALLLFVVSVGEYILSDEEKNHDLLREGFVPVYGAALSAKDFGYYLQSILLSELRGLFALMSKKEFIARAAVQRVNGQQAELRWVPKDPEVIYSITKDIGIKGDLLRQQPHRYKYLITQQDFSEQELIPALSFDKSEKDKGKLLDVAVAKKQEGTLLDVATSHYQLQFLDWLCSRPKKSTVDLSLDGSFLIAEKDYVISWDMNTLLPSIVPKEYKQRRNHKYGDHAWQKEATRVYVSQPFTLIPTQDVPEKRLRYKKTKAYRYVGIDIGEYGVAYTVIEVKDDKPHILAGPEFISTNKLQAIRKEVKGMKQRQHRGTFTMAQSHIAALREDVAHSLRNQIHAIAIRYDAQIVYERQVSGFEEGAKRIEKIYATLKKADVYSRNTNDADKGVSKQTWGQITKDERASGREVNANATSQFCTKCKRWYKDFMFEDKKLMYEVVLVDSQKISIALDKNVQVFGFVGGEYTVKGSKLSYGEVQKYVSAYMRPPLESSTWADATANFNISISKEERGNSAGYICPIIGCGNVDDADKQASKTIALMGYARQLFKDQSKNDKSLLDLEWKAREQRHWNVVKKLL